MYSQNIDIPTIAREVSVSYNTVRNYIAKYEKGTLFSKRVGGSKPTVSTKEVFFDKNRIKKKY